MNFHDAMKNKTTTTTIKQPFVVTVAREPVGSRDWWFAWDVSRDALVEALHAEGLEDFNVEAA